MRSTIQFRAFRAFAELTGWLLIAFITFGIGLGIIAEVTGVPYEQSFALAVIPASIPMVLGLVRVVVQNIVITTTSQDSLDG